ncbi:hypothetical protein U769_15510 [Pseudomonas aeruginosa MTB-1]|nr:hypothetical protein U769_15510 [Pseudomonas aeruginosa MTB-1]
MRPEADRWKPRMLLNAIFIYPGDTTITISKDLLNQ